MMKKFIRNTLQLVGILAAVGIVCLLAVTYLNDVNLPEIETDTATGSIYLDLIIALPIGLMITLFVLPLVPGAIERLSNKPNRSRPEHSEGWNYKESTFGFFTELNPGRVKIIERGGRFIRCIMRFDDHHFFGERGTNNLTIRNAAYWEVVESEREPDSHPIRLPHKKTSWLVLPLLWWVWKRWVYAVTGYVFTGFWPFQQVLVYPIMRYKKLKHADGTEEIIDIQDYSDHFRVADFQFPVRVEEADTQDKVPVRVLSNTQLRVFNPYHAAYGTDDWSARVTSAISDEITHFTRPRPIEEVLSAKDDGEIRELSNSIKRIGDRSQRETENSLIPIGIQVTQALIPDISPSNSDEGEKLRDLAFARVDRDAMAERAKGRAANLREQAAAAKENGHIGLAVLAAERNVRTAEAAGDKAIVIVGSGENADPLQAAMLHELKQLNQSPHAGEKGGSE